MAFPGRSIPCCCATTSCLKPVTLAYALCDIINLSLNVMLYTEEISPDSLETFYQQIPNVHKIDRYIDANTGYLILITIASISLVAHLILYAGLSQQSYCLLMFAYCIEIIDGAADLLIGLLSLPAPLINILIPPKSNNTFNYTTSMHSSSDMHITDNETEYKLQRIAPTMVIANQRDFIKSVQETDVYSLHVTYICVRLVVKMIFLGSVHTFAENAAESKDLDEIVRNVRLENRTETTVRNTISDCAAPQQQQQQPIPPPLSTCNSMKAQPPLITPRSAPPRAPAPPPTSGPPDKPPTSTTQSGKPPPAAPASAPPISTKPSATQQQQPKIEPKTSTVGNAPPPAVSQQQQFTSVPPKSATETPKAAMAKSNIKTEATKTPVVPTPAPQPPIIGAKQSNIDTTFLAKKSSGAQSPPKVGVSVPNADIVSPPKSALKKTSSTGGRKMSLTMDNPPPIHASGRRQSFA